MKDNDKAISIGLVVNAKGGTSIKQWREGSQFYSEALSRIKIARKTGILKGILWHQGESDRKDGAYLDKLVMLISSLRKDLDLPNLPFVAGQVYEKKIPSVNSQIADLPNRLLYTSFVSSKGLTTFDGTHFDNNSVKVLGKRYAEEMLKLQLDNL